MVNKERKIETGATQKVCESGQIDGKESENGKKEIKTYHIFSFPPPSQPEIRKLIKGGQSINKAKGKMVTRLHKPSV